MIFGPKLTPIQINYPHERTPVRIVNDGMISTVGVGEGRMLPVLIVNADNRPDLKEYAQVHIGSGAGDVVSQWAFLPDYPDTVMLLITVIRPVQLKALIAFELSRNQGVLVELILAAKGLYLLPGSEGDRLKNVMNKPKVLMEIPERGFRSKWDKIYMEWTVRKMRSRGLTRHDAKRAAKESIKLLRATGDFRLGNVIDAEDDVEKSEG